MNRRSIAILGSRGIPNRYGGFEQLAEHLSTALLDRGLDVTVYNPHWHPYLQSDYCGVRIRRIWCPERRLGAAAHFIYDALCLLDACFRKYDAILELGYGSAAPFYLLFPSLCRRIVTNMDGIEWKRTKWRPLVQRFAMWAEKIGATKSALVVADNPGIQNHLMGRYRRRSVYIPYGAEPFLGPNLAMLTSYNVSPFAYYLAIARFEPENNLELIIRGYLESGTKNPLLLIGDASRDYGKQLRKLTSGANVRFLGGIYDTAVLNNLRHYAAIYFHGHSVGGTNPSLIEAMAAGARICAHDNPFNRAVTEEGACYFSMVSDIKEAISKAWKDEKRTRERLDLNLNKVRYEFCWKKIADQYVKAFEAVIGANEVDIHCKG